MIYHHFMASKPTKNSTPETLGLRLRRLRIQANLTQSQLADKIKSIQAVISSYERGRTEPNLEMVIKIAKALKVSADELLGLKAGKESNYDVDRRILRRMQALATLPEHDQKSIFKYIDLLSKHTKA